MNYNCYFKFLQFSLGLYEGKEFLSGEAMEDFDWKGLGLFGKKQALTGVLFEGIQRLPKEVAPDAGSLMAWMGLSQGIYRRNLALNKASAEIYNKVKAEGFRCCILKGQGNALMYPNPHSRIPGDVDVWVDAEREDIRGVAHYLVDGHGTVGKESLNHIELSMDGVAVELHSTPAILNNPLYNHRLQKWLERNADLQCGNIVSLPDGAGEMAIPTTAFNVIYQLCHLYHHLFDEGVGLRQVVDYYYVVKMLNVECEMLNCKQNGSSSSQHSTLNIQHSLKRLGLWKFARAVMWVLHEVLGLSSAQMIAPMDEKRGRMLLDEILAGGNFGQYDDRQHFGRGTLGHNIQRMLRDLRLGRYYPAEALAEPFFRIGHFFWRIFLKVKG